MKLIVLTEAQNAHYSKLAASEQEAYLNKSASDRDADIEKALAADPIVFKGEKTGIEVRKSQGDFAMKIAKQAEEGAVTMAKQADEIAKRDVEIKKTRIRKLATELFANRSSGTPETLDFIVEKLEDNADALAVLKGLVATSKVGQPAPGIGGTEQAADEPAQKKLDAVIAKHATDNKLSIPAATKAVLATAEGRALYHEANP